jgi:YDG domain
MKKIAIVLFVLFISYSSVGQILISQVYEGVGDNKWIEITNVGANSIDLTSPIQYKVGIWQSAGTTGNGAISGNPTSFINLSGTLLHGQKYLIRNTNAATNVPHAVMPVGNNSNATVASFDGNDALAIFKGTNTIIDAFGVGINYNDISYSRSIFGIMPSPNFYYQNWDTIALSYIAMATNYDNSYIGAYNYSGVASTVSGNLPSLNTIYGTASNTASFIVDRQDVSYFGPAARIVPPPPGICGDFIITPPIGFEIATSLNFTTTIGTNSSPLNLGHECSFPATVIYIRLAANTPVGNYSGNIIVGVDVPLFPAVTLETHAVNVIIPKQVTIVGLTSNDKQFDGTTTATLSGMPSLIGVLPSQVANVSLGGTPIANFNDASVGSNKPVSVSGYAISGTASSNYTLVQPLGLTASIVSNNKVVNLKLFIEGYYIGANTMASKSLNQGVTSNTSIVEDIMVELRNAATYQLVATTIATLYSDGSAVCNFNTLQNGSYFIVVKSNNTIQTWSANPVAIIANPVTYDFTTAANKAFGNNMMELANGVYGFYSGDINQDEVVDGSDSTNLVNDIENANYGSLSTDLNGDGVVDGSDSSFLINNTENAVFSSHP